MSYFSKTNHIDNDERFDANIHTIDLINYSNEAEFTNSIHEKFYHISAHNLTIGSTNNLF